MFEILQKNSDTSDEISKYKNRRKRLLAALEEEFAHKKGKVVLFAPIEQENQLFLQDSSFYYFTGISEPACVFVADMQEGSQLYVPQFGALRSKWIHSQDVINEQTISLFGIDELKMLGAPMSDYQMCPYFAAQDYSEVIALLQDMVAKKQTIYTLYPSDKRAYACVRQVVDRLLLFVPEAARYVVDISAAVAQIRRKKKFQKLRRCINRLE